jgi:hypothetical protein
MVSTTICLVVFPIPYPRKSLTTMPSFLIASYVAFIRVLYNICGNIRLASSPLLVTTPNRLPPYCRADNHHLGFFRHRLPLLSSLTSYAVHGNWANILVARDILYEMKSKCLNNKTSLDACNPRRVAQQFIFFQENTFLMNSTSNGLNKPMLGQEEVNQVSQLC